MDNNFKNENITTSNSIINTININNDNIIKIHNSNANNNSIIINTNICSICNKKLGNLKNLKKHYKLHCNIRKYSCSICLKSYKRSDHLSRHMKIHNELNEKKYECEFCHKQFLLKYHLKSHINHIHNLNYDKFICEICGMKFPKKIKYLKHKRREHEEKNINKIICYYPYCNKKFLNQNALNAHIQKYHKDFNIFEDNINNNEDCNNKEKYFYKCPYDNCNKIYSTHFNLSVHVKTFHLKIKSFKCNYCNKYFYHKSSLKRHINLFHIYNKLNYFNKIKDEKKEEEIDTIEYSYKIDKKEDNIKINDDYINFNKYENVDFDNNYISEEFFF